MFEWDEKKSQSNKRKHGITFDASIKLWADDNLCNLKAKTINEERYLILAKLDSIYWSAIYTYRNEKIRIISVRRSRKNEVDYYESKMSR